MKKKELEKEVKRLEGDVAFYKKCFNNTVTNARKTYMELRSARKQLAAISNILEIGLRDDE